MADTARLHRQQLIREAEGYLDLLTVFGDRWSPSITSSHRLAQRALEVVSNIDPTGPQRLQVLYLRGQSLRILGRYQEAICPLEAAARQEPENMHVWLALGWCYKRISRLDLAIKALEEALVADPSQGIIHYNLACYWSLTGNASTACGCLARALDIDPDYRDRIGSEHDFDPIRQHPEFQTITTVVV